MLIRSIIIIFTLFLTAVSYGQTGGDVDTLDENMAYAVPDSEEYIEEILPDSVSGEDCISVYHTEKDSVSGEEKVVLSHVHSSDSARICRSNVELIIADSLYWIGVEECFSVFDSLSPDPYGYDTTAFVDSVDKFLCASKYAQDGEWYFPIKKEETHVTSPFGFRRYKWHYGTDLKLEVGDTLVSAFDGVVRISKYNPRGYGYYVLIRHHNGLETLYGHMSRIDVEVGQEVKAGEMIGLGGNTGRSTGSHLHFEVRYKGKAIDPAVFYDFDQSCLTSCDFTITPQHFAYYRELSKAVYHRIRSGDYLGKIAARYHTSISKICRLNNIRRTTVLRIGRVLRVR